MTPLTNNIVLDLGACFIILKMGEEGTGQQVPALHAPLPKCWGLAGEACVAGTCGGRPGSCCPQQCPGPGIFSLVAILGRALGNLIEGT